jgi:hypothetical protein
MATNATALFEQLQDEAAALPTIERMVAEKRTESEVLDYKAADQIPDRDRRTLWSKALSAFANTEGGVVVWGVDCRKEKDGDSSLMLDRPTGNPAMAPNATEFAQKLADLLATATADVVEGVRIVPVRADGQAGYVACLIPEGRNKPYRAMFADERYYMRQPDRMASIPHSLLRTLFFPAVNPVLGVDVTAMPESLDDGRTASIDFLAHVTNLGNATARDAFVDVQLSHDMQVVKCPIDWWDKVGRQQEPANSRVLVTAFASKRPLHPAYAQSLCRFRWTGTLDEFRDSPPFVLEFKVYAHDVGPRHLRVKFIPFELVTHRQRTAVLVEGNG